ncbi:hypothetical protein LQZ24_01890 [Fructobacillus sp. M1-13]|uniref:Uncharacterized protein n=1 Tax=Fructobacillus papyriferae TaxID=2713171 RepID=A0ABS5QQL0_9LACO|nr:hypothetical protein [Fructobacillus papyriferae]MBS9334790.1 hypothetical protein [Fructobacillus papyriferae]MCD2158780.1 hypothetical protein [Fructobacillus papyriferae]
MAFENVKRIITQLKEINALQKQAKKQGATLQRAIKDSQKDIEAIKRDVNRYQFKIKGPLARIQETLAKHDS